MDPSALPAPRATAPADCRDIAVGFTLLLVYSHAVHR